MPTYEYLCRDCGERLEVVQSFADDALTTCPACEGQLRKVFSAAGIIFKGSGWHVKDYADKGGGRSSRKDDGGTDGAAGKDAATKKGADTSTTSDASSGNADSSSGSSGADSSSSSASSSTGSSSSTSKSSGTSKGSSTSKGKGSGSD